MWSHSARIHLRGRKEEKSNLKICSVSMTKISFPAVQKKGIELSNQENASS